MLPGLYGHPQLTSMGVGSEFSDRSSGKSLHNFPLKRPGSVRRGNNKLPLDWLLWVAKMVDDPAAVFIHPNTHRLW
jgi:hypothetical protein